MELVERMICLPEKFVLLVEVELLDDILDVKFCILLFGRFIL